MKTELSKRGKSRGMGVGAVGVSVWILMIVFSGGCFDRSDEAPAVPDEASRRMLNRGEVIGFASDPGAHVWRGIPFASPPEGDLRWRSPRSPAAWEGTLEALEYGPSCIQFAPPGGGRDGASAGSVTGSEDCLYLNVYAPRFAPNQVPIGDARLPVMFWIHGGGNTIGDATLYDGGLLATQQRVIVVTVHYRLGALGWFTHPALRGGGTTSDDRSGNYGTLDLVRGLEWVQENIAAFGGDPGRVTVFGESAGGSNTFSMLLSPRAGGLFQRAIVQSGSARTSTLAEAENFIDDLENPGSPYSSSEVIVKHLVKDGTAKDRTHGKTVLAGMKNSEIQAYLRGLDADELLSVYDGSGMGGMYRSPELIADGRVLPQGDPLIAFAKGNYNRVPTILGTNRDENRLFNLFGSDHVTRAFGIPLWLNDEEQFVTDAEYQTKMWKVRGVDGPAVRMREHQGPSVFAYRFDWDEEGRLLLLDLSSGLGAAHGFEIPFVFGWLTMGPITSNVFPEEGAAGARKLSNAMMSYWGRFAYSGDPGTGQDGDLPQWASWSNAPDGETFIVFDTEQGGGVRMSTQAGLTRDTVLAQIAGDDRLKDPLNRCALYYTFVQWGAQVTEAEYATIDDGVCSAYPISDFPWKS